MTQFNTLRISIHIKRAQIEHGLNKPKSFIKLCKSYKVIIYMRAERNKEEFCQGYVMHTDHHTHIHKHQKQ